MKNITYKIAYTEKMVFLKMDT